MLFISTSAADRFRKKSEHFQPWFKSPKTTTVASRLRIGNRMVPELKSICYIWISAKKPHSLNASKMLAQVSDKGLVRVQLLWWFSSSWVEINLELYSTWLRVSWVLKTHRSILGSHWSNVTQPQVEVGERETISFCVTWRRLWCNNCFTSTL